MTLEEMLIFVAVVTVSLRRGAWAPGRISFSILFAASLGVGLMLSQSFNLSQMSTGFPLQVD